jgi:O-antigen/teichoic acid export membrane protein
MSYALVIPACLLLILLGRWVLFTFGAGYSERSMDLLRILALTSLPMTVERVHFAALKVRGRLKEVLAWRTALTVAVVGFSWWFVRTGGLEAIGWVYLTLHVTSALLIVALRRGAWEAR